MNGKKVNVGDDHPIQGSIGNHCKGLLNSKWRYFMVTSESRIFG